LAELDSVSWIPFVVKKQMHNAVMFLYNAAILDIALVIGVAVLERSA
jgi:hypothetical protein